MKLNHHTKGRFKRHATFLLVKFLMTYPFVCSFLHSNGQMIPTFSPTLFTTSNGLCNNTIMTLEADSAGYLWIGTAHGLSRFDGRRFTNFFHSPGDSLSIGHNFISDILCDGNGNIWILHALGLCMFQPKTHQFSNYPIPAEFKNYQGNFSVMEDDGAGQIWLGNQHGPAIFNMESKSFLRYKEMVKSAGDLYHSGSLQGIWGIKKAGGGNLWLSGEGAFFVLDKNKGKISGIKHPGLANLKGLGISYADTLNNLVFLSSFNDGMKVYNAGKGKLETYRTGKEWLSTTTYDPVRCIQPYNNEWMVMNSDLGLGFFSPSKGKIIPLSPYPYNRELNLQYLLADKEDIWIGTDNGLLQLKREKVILENISPTNPFEGTFSTLQVMAEDNLVFSHNYGRPIVYTSTLQGGPVNILKGVTGVLRYFFRDKMGNSWVSTENNVYRLSKNAATWQNVAIEGDNETQTGMLPRNFVEDNNGNLWLRMRNSGLFRLSKNEVYFEKFRAKGLPENGIFSGLAYDKASHTIWLSDENQGLFAFFPGQNEWAHHPLVLYGTMLKPAKIVLGNHGEVVFPDPNNGIGMYDPKSKQIKLVTQQQGLLSNYTSIINRDRDGNFWTISGEGVSKISGKDFSVINYSNKDLAKPQNLECGSDGWVYIATSYGLYRFDGAKLNPQKSSGKLLIDKVEVMGKAVDFSKPVRVQPGENDISVRISYVNRMAVFKPNVEYKFENEKQWISIEDRNLISFSRLEPGNYNLVIRERSEAESKHWQTVSWVIEKPVWLRGWFLAVLLALLGGSIFFFTQRRFKNIREKAKLKQKMAETEMAALRAQMNPHFIFNSINCIDAMVQEGDKYNATTYLNKFAKLLRNVLEGSRNATVSLSNDLDTLRLYLELECMRMDENFDWHIDIPDEVAAADIRVPSLIIQPYVENAILHGLRHLSGKKGNLQIRVGLKGDVLSYMITDNGVGREFAKSIQKTQHNSFGLDITRERIEHFNLSNPGSVTISDLINDKGEAEGTEVLVYIPLN